MQPIKRCLLLKKILKDIRSNKKKAVAFILLFLFLNSSCGSSKYRYLALSPLEQTQRKAYENYESVKNDDIEIRVARRLPDLILKSLKTLKNENEYQEAKSVLKRIKKANYTIFLLSVVNDKNKKIVIDPQKLVLKFFGELTEKEFNPVKQKDFYDLTKIKADGTDNLNPDFLISSKPLEISGNKEFFLVFPYEINDEHMTRITLKDVLIDEKEYNFEYFFYSANKYEKAKRMAQYTGMVMGGVALIVVGISAYTN